MADILGSNCPKMKVLKFLQQGNRSPNLSNCFLGLIKNTTKETYITEEKETNENVKRKIVDKTLSD